MLDYKKAETGIFSDTSRLIQQIVSLKYVYLGCFVVFILLAYFVNKYSPKEYEVNASIISVQNETSSILTSSNELFTGLDALSQNSNIENEINNLKSFARISSTISKLNLETGYFTEKDKLFKETEELYKKSPFTVNVDRSHLQPIGCHFQIILLTDSTFRLISKDNDIYLYNYVDNEVVLNHMPIEVDTVARFNTTIESALFKFSINYNKEYSALLKEKDRQFYFTFYHLDELTKAFYKKLEVTRASSMSSILNIQYSGENIEKVITFLNTYLNTYFEESLNRKNKIAISTINFIDDQLSEISDSLVASESVLRNYRSANQITDLSYQGQQLYESLQSIESDKSSLQVQERYYNYVINYLKQNSDVSGVTAPSSGMSDPIMTQMITDLLALNTERSNILGSQNTQSLFLNQIESRIETQRQLIIENATNSLNTLSLSLSELEYRADKTSKEITSLPKTELNMVSMQRNYDINDAIYTYLLQKRSEAAIAKASNYPDFEILEPAREITAKIVSPKTLINYAIAIIMALFLPTVFLIVREMLNDKVQTKTFLEKLTDNTVFGIVPAHEFKTESVVLDYPQSAITESFRNIRSSIFHKMKNMPKKVILMTSAQPKDGKSFISFNLAHIIAKVGVKTVIIDCDLHRPTLHKKFNDDNQIGLSNYMIGDAKIKDIIKTTATKDLYFIPAGPILPSPSEMIEFGALDEFMEDISKEFDYVIFDTTPLGIVADAMAVMRYATQIFVVCRNGYTKKEMLTDVLVNLESHGYDNYEIIFNGVDFKHSSRGQYTTYYK